MRFALSHSAHKASSWHAELRVRHTVSVFISFYHFTANAGKKIVLQPSKTAIDADQCSYVFVAAVGTPCGHQLGRTSDDKGQVAPDEGHGACKAEQAQSC